MSSERCCRKGIIHHSLSILLLGCVILLGNASARAAPHTLGFKDVTIRTLPAQTHLQLKLEASKQIKHIIQQGGNPWVMTRTAVVEKNATKQTKISWSGWQQSGVGREGLCVGFCYSHPSELINLRKQGWLIQMKPRITLPNGGRLEGQVQTFDMLGHRN